MLERIHQITSVGLFQDIRPAGAVIEYRTISLRKLQMNILRGCFPNRFPVPYNIWI